MTSSAFFFHGQLRRIIPTETFLHQHQMIAWATFNTNFERNWKIFVAGGILMELKRNNYCVNKVLSLHNAGLLFEYIWQPHRLHHEPEFPLHMLRTLRVFTRKFETLENLFQLEIETRLAKRTKNNRQTEKLNCARDRRDIKNISQHLWCLGDVGTRKGIHFYF